MLTSHCLGDSGQMLSTAMTGLREKGSTANIQLGISTTDPNNISTSPASSPETGTKQDRKQDSLQREGDPARALRAGAWVRVHWGTTGASSAWSSPP